MTEGQSDRDDSSVKLPISQVTLVYVKLTHNLNRIMFIQILGFNDLYQIATLGYWYLKNLKSNKEGCIVSDKPVATYKSSHWSYCTLMHHLLPLFIAFPLPRAFSHHSSIYNLCVLNICLLWFYFHHHPRWNIECATLEPPRVLHRTNKCCMYLLVCLLPSLDDRHSNSTLRIT